MVLKLRNLLKEDQDRKINKTRNEWMEATCKNKKISNPINRGNTYSYKNFMDEGCTIVITRNQGRAFREERDEYSFMTPPYREYEVDMKGPIEDSIQGN